MKDEVTGKTGPTGKTGLTYIASRKAGFTLVEILISVVILSIGVFALINMFTVGMKGILATEKRTVATNLAQDLMDEIFGKEWKDPDLEAEYPPLGYDSGENYRYSYDDVDDYSSWGPHPPKDIITGDTITEYATFTRKARVRYVSPYDLGEVVAPTDLKKITVTVSENSISPVEIVTIKAKY